MPLVGGPARRACRAPGSSPRRLTRSNAPDRTSVTDLAGLALRRIVDWNLPAPETRDGCPEGQPSVVSGAEQIAAR